MSSICLGFAEFTPHSLASSPAFDALHEGIDLAFDDFRLHGNQEGILCYPDSPSSARSESATAIAASTSSSSSSESDSDSGSSDSSIYYDDNDFHSI